jgi:peroxiredoxin Q/BCP
MEASQPGWVPGATSGETPAGEEDVMPAETAVSVEVGKPCPDVALETEHGTTRLSDWRGRPLVLYFYPRDMSPGCTNEACDFRDRYAEFQQAGATVVGVSTDSLTSHARFVAKHQLPFVLASDPEAQAARIFGVYKEKTLYGKKSWGIERSTFVIDKDGIVRAAFRRVRVAGHVERVLHVVESL